MRGNDRMGIVASPSAGLGWRNYAAAARFRVPTAMTEMSGSAQGWRERPRLAEWPQTACSDLRSAPRQRR